MAKLADRVHLIDEKRHRVRVESTRQNDADMSTGMGLSRRIDVLRNDAATTDHSDLENSAQSLTHEI